MLPWPTWIQRLLDAFCIKRFADRRRADDGNESAFVARRWNEAGRLSGWVDKIFASASADCSGGVRFVSQLAFVRLGWRKERFTFEGVLVIRGNRTSWRNIPPDFVLRPRGRSAQQPEFNHTNSESMAFCPARSCSRRLRVSTLHAGDFSAPAARCLRR